MEGRIHKHIDGVTSPIKRIFLREIRNHPIRIFILIFAVLSSSILSGFLVNKTSLDSVQASAGDYYIARAPGTNIISNNSLATEQILTYDTEVQTSADITRQSGNQAFRIQNTGIYLIMVNSRWNYADIGNNNRHVVRTLIKVGGSELGSVYGEASGYGRDSGLADEDGSTVSAIIDHTVVGGAGDDITFHVQNFGDTSVALADQFANESGIQIVRLPDDTDYLKVSRTSDINYTGTIAYGTADPTWNEFGWETQDAETDTAVLEWVSGNDITLKSAGHYLVTYSIAITTTGARNAAIYRLNLDDVEIPASRVVGYVRSNDGDDESWVQWTGIIEAAADDVLNIDWGSATEATNAGVMDEAAISIAKLPDTASYVRVRHDANRAGETTGIFPLDAEDEDDEGVHSTVSNTGRITGTVDSYDWLLFASWYLRTGVDSSRTAEHFRWSRTGSIQQYGSGLSYTRGDQGSTGTPAGGRSSAIIAENLGTNDYMELDYRQEAGTGDQQRDFIANRVGITGVALDTLVPAGFTVAGTFYSEAETGGEPGQCDGSTANLSLRVNGGTAITTTCTDATGTFTFSGVVANAGDTITVYSTGVDKANRAYVSDGTADTGMDIYENAVAVGDEQDGTVTIVDLVDYDNDQNATDMLFDAEDSSPDTIIVESGSELHIHTGDTFTPGGTITTNATGGDVHVDDSATLILGVASNFIGRDLIIDTGATVSVNSTTAVTNDIAVTGTLNGTGDLTVNGELTGSGTVTMTAGTLEQRVAAAENFGTTSGSNAWSLNDITFSNSHASTGFTITTQTGGNGGITVSGVMSIGKSGDSAGATTTLDAGNRTWTLSGTGGDPLQILASPAGALTPSTSTFTYTGNNGGGNTTIQSTTYNNLITNNGSETYALEGTTTANGDLTITAGTLDVTVANHDLTIGGNYSNSGTFTAQSGTVTFNATDAGNTIAGTLSGSSAFYDLTFNGISGAWALNAATEVDRDLTITNGTLTAPSGNLTVSRNWTNNGVFTHNSGTVVLDTTTTAIVAGATTFYSLTSTAAAKTIQFTAGETFTIASGGVLTLTGGADPNEIQIQSTTSSKWFIDHQGTESISNVQVINSGCDVSSTDIATSGSTDDGNNDSCWLFGSTYEQADFRFGQPNGLDIDYTSAPAENASYTTTGTGDNFRLRMTMHVGGSNLAQNGETFKLQFGEKTATTCVSGVSWGDVTTGSGAIRYYDGAARDDGDNLTGNVGDPVHNSDTVIDQDYEEANNFTNSVAAIDSGQDGMWDFSLENNSSVGGKKYCFKIVLSTGLDIDTYTNYPEITVDEELIFNIDATSKNWGVINPGDNPTNQTTTLTTTTNAASGYVIYSRATQLLTRGSFTIPVWTGTNAAPTTFPNGSFGLGYTTDDSSLTGGTADRFTNGGPNYAGFITTGPGDPVADRASGPVLSAVDTITYRLAADVGQEAGEYTTIIVYFASLTF